MSLGTNRSQSERYQSNGNQLTPDFLEVSSSTTFPDPSAFRLLGGRLHRNLPVIVGLCYSVTDVVSGMK